MEFSRPEGAFSADPTLWLYTSLSSGSSTVVTATSRLEGILKANRIPFKALDVATEEKARMLWGRRAGERKLPGLVKQGMVLADLAEVEEWNEYGEVRENLLDEDEATASPALASLSKPATPAVAASTIPSRPAAPTPASAATHNAVAGPPAATPSAAAIKAAVSTTSLKSTATTASADSGKSAEHIRKENMLSLAEQVAARAKKSTGLRTSSGQLLTKTGNASAPKAATTSAKDESKDASEATTEESKPDEADKGAEPPSAAVPVKAETLDETETSGTATAPTEVVKEAPPSANEPEVEVIPVKQQIKESHSVAKAKDVEESKDPVDDEVKSPAVEAKGEEPKPDAPASTVVSTDAGEQAPAKQEAAAAAVVAKKEDSGEDEDANESEEDKDEDDGNVETRKTQEQGAADPKGVTKSVAD